MLDSNEDEIILPSLANSVSPDGNLGILTPNIDSNNENSIFSENSEAMNESKDLIFIETEDGPDEGNYIEAIPEYGESKWIDENSTAIVNRIQNIKSNINISVGFERRKIEFGHATIQANNYIHLRPKGKPPGTKNINYTCLLMVLTTSIFLLTALKTSALANIMKTIEDDKIPPFLNEKILQNLGMIEGKKQLQSLFLEEHKELTCVGNSKAELFSKKIKNDYNIGIDSTTIFKEFNVFNFDDYLNFASWRLEDTKTGEVFEQISPLSGLASDVLEARELQGSILKILGRKGETAKDVVKRVGIYLGVYESNDIPQSEKKIEKHIANGGDTEGNRISDIFEATEEVSDDILSQLNWSTRKYISRQFLLIINELYTNGVINDDITIDDISFNAFGEIRLELGNPVIHNKNDEGHSNDFEDKSKDQLVRVGNILGQILFEDNEETISDKELSRWKEIQSKCIKAKELKTYSISDFIYEFSDILGPLHN